MGELLHETPILRTHLVVFAGTTGASTRIEFNGREALDTKSIYFVSSAVHLGEYNVVVVLVVLSQLVVDWLKLLAVSTPAKRQLQTVEST